jgi:type VI protein secretion system component VasK
MSWIWPILAILVIALWVYAFIDIVRRRHTMSGGKIAAWVIAILVFPIVGTIAYFLVRGTGGSQGAPRDPMPGNMP